MVANDQIGRAKANLQLATDTVQRLTPLAAQGYVPVQQLDQAQTAQRDATTSLAQAQADIVLLSGRLQGLIDACALADVRDRGGRITLFPGHLGGRQQDPLAVDVQHLLARQARSSTMGPRAVLTRMAVFFMRRSTPSSKRSRVSSVKGDWMTM